jgi:hypothetical protein
MSLKNSKDNIGIRTREFPTSSAVPQPTAPPRAPPSFQFKVCKSVHHCTIQMNHQHVAITFQFIILTFVYNSTIFGPFPAQHQELNDGSGSLWFYLRIVVIFVLCSWMGWPARPRKQHDYHYETKVKAEAATAVIELPMMGGKTSETC